MRRSVVRRGTPSVERLRLRIQGIELGTRQVVDRGGKGNKGWMTILPDRLFARLRSHPERVGAVHLPKLPAYRVGTEVPYPHWLSSGQIVFSSSTHIKDRDTGTMVRTTTMRKRCKG